VPTDEEGRVLGFIEKPPLGEAPTNLINAGVYVLEPSILERIPEGEVWSAERRLFPGLVDEGAGLYATGTDAYWMDIGTPRKYLQANLDALSGAYRTDAAAALVPKEVLAAKGAFVAEDAKVSSACIGPGARVEAGAVLERAVLLAGARMARGAEVRDSILGEGATVEAGARVADQGIADHEVVRPSS
jgi:NDP-sugar pyrophosphorylase family protein